MECPTLPYMVQTLFCCNFWHFLMSRAFRMKLCGFTIMLCGFIIMLCGFITVLFGFSNNIV